MNETLAFDPQPMSQPAFTKGKLPYDFAFACAKGYKEILQPHCAHIEIAGSLRRHKMLVKDIELCLIEKTPGSVYNRLMLFRQARMLTSFWKKHGPKYWQFKDLQWEKGPFIISGNINSGIQYSPIRAVFVHVFISQPDYWGWTFFIRTGPQEWNIAVMRKINSMGYRIKNNTLMKNGAYIQFAQESEIFDFLNIAYIDPQDRTKLTARRLF